MNSRIKEAPNRYSKCGNDVIICIYSANAYKSFFSIRCYFTSKYSHFKTLFMANIKHFDLFFLSFSLKKFHTALNHNNSNDWIVTINNFERDSCLAYAKLFRCPTTRYELFLFVLCTSANYFLLVEFFSIVFEYFIRRALFCTITSTTNELLIPFLVYSVTQVNTKLQWHKSAKSKSLIHQNPNRK